MGWPAAIQNGGGMVSVAKGIFEGTIRVLDCLPDPSEWRHEWLEVLPAHTGWTSLLCLPDGDVVSQEYA